MMKSKIMRRINCLTEKHQRECEECKKQKDEEWAKENPASYQLGMRRGDVYFSINDGYTTRVTSEGETIKRKTFE
jgi:hypothetical protein